MNRIYKCRQLAKPIIGPSVDRTRVQRLPNYSDVKYGKIVLGPRYATQTIGANL